MHYLDIIFVILLLIGAIRGFMKGFVFEIAILGTLFLGSYAAFKLAYLLKPFVQRMGINADLAGFASAMLMFIFVAVGIYFLAKLFTGLINITALGVFNKIMGAVFGFFKYLFLVSVGLYFFNQVDVKHHLISADKKAESNIYYPVLKLAPALLPVMKELKEDVVGL